MTIALNLALVLFSALFFAFAAYYAVEPEMGATVPKAIAVSVFCGVLSFGTLIANLAIRTIQKLDGLKN